MSVCYHVSRLLTSLKRHKCMTYANIQHSPIICKTSRGKSRVSNFTCGCPSNLSVDDFKILQK